MRVKRSKRKNLRLSEFKPLWRAGDARGARAGTNVKKQTGRPAEGVLAKTCSRPATESGAFEFNRKRSLTPRPASDPTGEEPAPLEQTNALAPGDGADAEAETGLSVEPGANGLGPSAPNAEAARAPDAKADAKAEAGLSVESGANGLAPSVPDADRAPDAGADAAAEAGLSVEPGADGLGPAAPDADAARAIDAGADAEAEAGSRVETGAGGSEPSAIDAARAPDAASRSRSAGADAGTVGGSDVESVDDGLDPSALRDAVITLAIESWRISQTFSRLLEKLEPKAQSRYAGQIRWFSKKAGEALGQAQLRLVNIEGQAYDPGMAATALNMDEFSENDALVVDQMLEPIVMGKDGLVRSGTVMLKKA